MASRNARRQQHNLFPAVVPNCTDLWSRSCNYVRLLLCLFGYWILQSLLAWLLTLIGLGRSFPQHEATNSNRLLPWHELMGFDGRLSQDELIVFYRAMQQNPLYQLLYMTKPQRPPVSLGIDHLAAGVLNLCTVSLIWLICPSKVYNPTIDAFNTRFAPQSSINSERRFNRNRFLRRCGFRATQFTLSYGFGIHVYRTRKFNGMMPCLINMSLLTSLIYCGMGYWVPRDLALSILIVHTLLEFVGIIFNCCYGRVNRDWDPSGEQTRAIRRQEAKAARRQRKRPNVSRRLPIRSHHEHRKESTRPTPEN
ncbi:hypothetical protein EJ08DRAFT_163352 [Tothia fuscella]|uniref:Uncharacterized protein n=1 Tax=Tothia fuscella TaxID=1048955 RepID=A0A9P4U058_9PEZI|nr:hypothetical protein EJ08DRAFT_163352 [Tothia fuscella]